MSSSSTVEIETCIPAGRIFKIVFLEWHNLAPKIVPDIIKSASATHVDDGHIGSVRTINFTPVMPFPYVKERLDFLDVDNCEAKQTLVEGGDLGTKLESASSHFKFIPTSSGGSICKVTGTVKTLPGVNSTDEEAKAKEALIKTIKATEAYLLANPTVGV